MIYFLPATTITLQDSAKDFISERINPFFGKGLRSLGEIWFALFGVVNVIYLSSNGLCLCSLLMSRSKCLNGLSNNVRNGEYIYYYIHGV